jgi:hypothetical protein
VQRETRANVDRALRTNGLHGKSVAAHRHETIVHGVETQFRLAPEIRDETIDGGVIPEEPSSRNLLRTRRPCADVSDDVVHRADHIGGRDRPADAQTRRGKRLRDRVHYDHVWGNRRTKRDGVDVLQPARGDHPVHLVVHHEQRALGRSSSRILLEHEIANISQLLGREHRAGWIQRRVQRQQPRAAHMRAEQFGRRQKPRRRVALDHHRQSAEHLAVVIVVPRRNAEDDSLTRIDHRSIERIDRRPRARCNEDRLHRKIEAETPLIEISNGRAQALQTVRRRIRRLAGTQCLDDGVLELTRNPKLLRAEIPNGEIEDLSSLPDERANVAGDFEDGRAAKSVGEV